VSAVAKNAGTEYLAATKADALAHLALSLPNVRYYLHVAMDGLLPAQPDKYIPGAFRAGVRITRKAAQNFINDAFRAHLETRGAALRIHVVAEGPRETYCSRRGEFVANGKPHYAIWIG
jgi:hypothetical protein